MDYSKKTELRIMSHNIWCGPVYNRDLHMRDIYMRYLPDVLGLQEMTPNLYQSRIVELLEPCFKGLLRALKLLYGEPLSVGVLDLPDAVHNLLNLIFQHGHLTFL